jgi:hypothetical protein
LLLLQGGKPYGFFSLINEFMMERPDEGMESIWHGAEPQLLSQLFSQGLPFSGKIWRGHRQLHPEATVQTAVAEMLGDDLE